VIDPLFWLGVSILLVAVSLTAVLVAALPALTELSRAARSAEKLFDTLNRELPPTLESIRLTGLELTDLSDDLSEGVQSAGRVAQQIDQSITGVKRQAQQAQVATRSLFAGVQAAWKTLNQPSAARQNRDDADSPVRSSTHHSIRNPNQRNILPSETQAPLGKFPDRRAASRSSALDTDLDELDEDDFIGDADVYSSTPSFAQDFDQAVLANEKSEELAEEPRELRKGRNVIDRK
jgi:uncharacterized protein YoxC